MPRPIILLISFLALVCSSGVSHADLIVPAGLNPGDTYHLAFVTSGERDATSTDISEYNDFVNDEAAASGSLTAGSGIAWFAIASTAAVDARDNALVSGPVFLLDGTGIADGFDDLWDRDILAPINLTQSGTILKTLVWSGTGPDGSSQFQLSAPDPSVGSSGVTDLMWIFNPSVPTFEADEHPLYALSEPLTVPPTAVPEPASAVVWLLLGGGGILLSYCRRRRTAKERHGNAR